MNITINQIGEELYAAIKGEMDSLTSPAIAEQILPMLDAVQKVTLDFAELKYISSAGLRVLLAVMRAMDDREGVTVKNASPEIMSILDLTGYTGDLTIE